MPELKPGYCLFKTASLLVLLQKCMYDKYAF